MTVVDWALKANHFYLLIYTNHMHTQHYTTNKLMLLSIECTMSLRFRNPSYSDMDYRIFSVRMRSFLCKTLFFGNVELFFLSVNSSGTIGGTDQINHVRHVPHKSNQRQHKQLTQCCDSGGFCSTKFSQAGRHVRQQPVPMCNQTYHTKDKSGMQPGFERKRVGSFVVEGPGGHSEDLAVGQSFGAFSLI